MDRRVCIVDTCVDKGSSYCLNEVENKAAAAAAAANNQLLSHTTQISSTVMAESQLS